MNRQQVYDCIVQYWRAYLVPPTLRRVAALAGCSLTNAHYHVGFLVKLGLVEKVRLEPHDQPRLVPVEIKQKLQVLLNEESHDGQG